MFWISKDETNKVNAVGQGEIPRGAVPCSILEYQEAEVLLAARIASETSAFMELLAASNQ